MPTSLRLITFDLDDTLWPCAPVIRAAEQVLHDWLTTHAPDLAAAHDIASLRRHRLALAESRPELRHDLTALRLVQLQQLLAEFGHAPELAAVGSALFRTARNRVAPYAEVRPVLAKLRRSHVLVSVTNGNAQVERTPLAGCFDHNLTAAEVGAAKPDPAMLKAACALAGVAPAQALHVGDDPERDIVPARDIGMATAWIRRDDQPWPAALAPADLQAGDLSELLGILEDLGRTASS